ncbi:hypothetical protein C2I36_16155 [Rhodobacteraceae bacterium WD3A24]|nr:hypothetical protein C2I36_16155 [Rhodobacteraceae bacterium WD3A24]
MRRVLEIPFAACEVQMKVLGITMGATANGKQLKDGSLAWYQSDNNILVISEEQAAGSKHAGGFEASLQKFYEKKRSRPDLVAVSSCCEPEITDVSALEAQFRCEVRVVNHHLSHAHQAAWTNGYRDALIVVMDAGGNMLEPFDERGTDWWRYCREQFSVFECVDGKISLLDRKFSAPYDIGLGEFWRYITYACDFDTSTKASKVMELAAYDDSSGDAFLEPYFDTDLSRQLRNNPPNKRLLKELVLKQCAFGGRGREITIGNIAGWAQRSLVEVVVGFLNDYQRQTNQELVCLTGGVALNCKLVQAVRARTSFEDVIVGYCPSDKGQSLGNCLAIQSRRPKAGSRSGLNPFRGMERVASASDIRTRLGEHQQTHIVEKGVGPSSVLRLIEKGFIVGTWRGRGEIGERALGNSSILADPHLPGIKERLNEIKGRSIETPVAPVFSKEFFSSHFGEIHANYTLMSETVYQKSKGGEITSSMSHVDGSIRPQVIDEEAPSYLARMLAEVSPARAKKFALLNTSFNGPGRPMAGTVDQAVSEFTDLGLDALSCPNNILVRRKDVRMEATLDASDPDKMFFEDLEDFQARSSAFGLHQSVEKRERFLLFDNYIRWAAQGRKVTTIRFKEGVLSIAGPKKLPLVETKDFKQSAMQVQKLEVEVIGFTVKKFRHLDRVDAQRDGFEKTSHLKQTLKNIYPRLTDDDYVTINFISILANQDQ